MKNNGCLLGQAGKLVDHAEDGKTQLLSEKLFIDFI